MEHPPERLGGLHALPEQRDLVLELREGDEEEPAHAVDADVLRLEQPLKLPVRHPARSREVTHAVERLERQGLDARRATTAPRGFHGTLRGRPRRARAYSPSAWAKRSSASRRRSRRTRRFTSPPARSIP